MRTVLGRWVFSRAPSPEVRGARGGARDRVDPRRDVHYQSVRPVAREEQGAADVPRGDDAPSERAHARLAASRGRRRARAAPTRAAALRGRTAARALRMGHLLFRHEPTERDVRCELARIVDETGDIASSSTGASEQEAKKNIVVVMLHTPFGEAHSVQPMFLGPKSIVFQARVYQRAFAIKVVSRRGAPAMLREIRALEAIGAHPNVVALLECAKPPHLAIALEWCDGALVDVPYAKRIMHMRSILDDLIKGIAFLHSRRVAHLDIKPDNILLALNLNGSFRLKYADFDCAHLSGETHESEFVRRLVGTDKYCAPEVYVFEAHPFHAASADIWSLGITFFAMLADRLPFKCAKPGILRFDRLNRDKMRLTDIFEHAFVADPALLAMINSMVVADPRERISASRLLDMWLAP